MKLFQLKNIWWLPLLVLFDLIYYLFIQFLTSTSLEMFKQQFIWMGAIVLFIISLLSLASVRWVKRYLDRFKGWSVSFKYLQILVYSFLLFIGVTAGIQFLIEFGSGQQRSLGNVIGNGLTYIFLHLVVGNAYIALSFFRESSQLKEDLILAEKTKAESELRALQQQMSPHFLFNNLNTLASLIPENKDKAILFTHNLSNIFRYVSKNVNKDLVSLSEELKLLNEYMELMHMRFGKAYDLDFDLGEINPQNYWMVPMALQITIENVIKHNSGDRTNPLVTKLYINEGFLCIENKIRKKRKSNKNKTGIGLKNLKERYQMLGFQGVQYSQQNENFLVQLPMIKRIQDESINH